jgi:hypothetical protein
MDGGNAIDLPDDIIRQMRLSAPNLGTGYADAGCGYFEALPTRLPYLFEFAHALATGHSEASRLDLLRLSQDLRTLGRLNSRPSTVQEFNPFSSIDRARVVWRLSPERIAFQNFLVEFASSTAEHPIAHPDRGKRGLRTIEIDDRFHFLVSIFPERFIWAPPRFEFTERDPVST